MCVSVAHLFCVGSCPIALLTGTRNRRIEASAKSLSVCVSSWKSNDSSPSLVYALHPNRPGRIDWLRLNFSLFFFRLYVSCVLNAVSNPLLYEGSAPGILQKTAAVVTTVGTRTTKYLFRVSDTYL